MGKSLDGLEDDPPSGTKAQTLTASQPDAQVSRNKMVATGILEVSSISDTDFEKQRRMHQREQAKASGVTTTGEPASNSTIKRSRIKASNDAADIEGFLGPWAGYEEEGRGEGVVAAPTEEEVSRFIMEKSLLVPTSLSGYIEMGQEKSIFHGRHERDEQGNTYMTSLAPLHTPTECFPPKGSTSTWVGHTKGVNSIRFFPRTGRLLLSGSQDHRVKLWSVYGERECLRTFYGHNKPVREVGYNFDGTTFFSCSYDKTVKVWDTETGKCTFYKHHRALPYCATFHPMDANFLLVGTADRKILQWDLRAGTKAGFYRGHRDAVNSITFFDGNRKFVTSSDDRTLRVWECGEFRKDPQLVASSDMQRLLTAAHHPTEDMLAFQSLDNRIQIYAPFQNSLSQRSKRFIGHATGGYACQIGFSPDGRFIYSGDARGHVIIWDWTSGAIVRRLEGHKQVCMGVQWNPNEQAKLATCSWDGTIKYWE